MLYAAFEQARYCARRRLSLRIEHRVAATDIDHHRMGAPLVILQTYRVLLAWTATGVEILPLAQKMRIYAVFRVKSRHVVVNYHFDPLRRHMFEQVLQLGHIEVVGGAKRIGAQGPEVVRGDRIGHIQGKIAVNMGWLRKCGEMHQPAPMPDQHSVGL